MEANSPLAHERRWWTLAVLCLSLTVISIDNTILNVALPSIVESLSARGSELQLLIDGYTIVFDERSRHLYTDQHRANVLMAVANAAQRVVDQRRDASAA